jgi:hypothetical protein
VSPDVLGAPRVIAIVVSAKFRSLRRPAGGPEHHAGRVERGGRPLSERNREPRRGGPSCSDSRRMSRGTERVSSAIRRRRGTPKRAHPRSVRRGGARGRLAARVARAPGPGRRDRGRGGLRPQLQQGLDRPDGRRGPHVRAALRAQARGRPARPAQPRDVRALEPDRRPDYLGALDWLRRYSRRLIAMWEQGGGAGHADARQAGCRSACRSWAARGRGALSSLAVQLEAARPGQPGARSPPPERLPPLVRPRRPPAWR